ncbi:PAS domain S-box protein [Haloplanus sp.]|uniref:PAS domain S-box protein n=1 Tax=Haloplanus sp. TaxID=1961696 RepID=UPI0026189899|nr:PAS domain S-box protein [Haloplanus sp.]
MHSPHPSRGPSGPLLALSAKLNGAETVETAVARTTDLVETVFDQPVVRVCAYDPATESVTTLSSSSSGDSAPDRMPEPLAERLGECGNDVSAGDIPEATVDTDPPDPIQAEALVPVGRDRVLRVGVTGSDGLSDVDSTVIEGIAANLEATLARIDHRQPPAVDCDVARAVFDRSGDATFVSDTDGTLVAVNRAAVELTGRDRETLLSTQLPDVSGEAAAESVRAHLERAATDASDPLTTTLKHARDGDFTVELTSRRIGVDGTSYLHTVAHDLSSDAQPRRGSPEPPAENDVTALRRLNELTAGVEAFDETIERLLSLGCGHFGLDTGVLSRVDGDDYEVEAVVDATGTHEQGAVYDLGDTMCDVTLAAATDPLAFADVATTDHRTHPAAETVRAYIAAPVSVDGETYGTVNFSMEEPRSEAFRPEEKEFVTLMAGWIGTELDRRRRVEELERYETILDAVDDPVYALDADWRFTFANEAADREFGDGEGLIGRHLSVGIDDSDVDRMQEGAERLVAADERSTAVEFELETADGGHKTVENRLGLIGAGDGEFRGTAGVLRDVTARNERQRQLEAFQQAIEKAVDGVAILDGEEYTYVDRTHVDMYGFENETQLLGNTWRALYDDDEIERLEAEAFPALESEGYWRGTVTGSRPDGSTFPAELSLTTIDDGRLVCTVRDETERRERERELTLKERAMDEATVSIQITDPTAEDAPLVYVNDGFERMTGYARENALGRNPRFLHGRDTDPERLARLREAVATGEPVSLELRTERKDGTPYWSRLSLTPITDESGAVENVIRIQQDVTERKERERRIAARSDFLKRIYELTTDPERTFDEKITGLLQAGRDHLDLPYGFLTRIERDDAGAGTQTVVEALGSHERLQPGAPAPLERSYCRRTIDQTKPMALTHAAEAGWADDAAYETFGLETYIGGEIVAGDDLYGTLCFASKEPRDRPFDGFERSFIRLVGRWVGYEIDRRNTQAELRDQRERLELTLSGTNTGIVEWDPEMDTVEWNETLVELVGREVESIEALNAAIHPDDRDRVQRRLEAMVETGDPWTGEFRVRDDTGDVVWLGTRATPVSENGGEPVTILATVSDISDRKQAEREQRRNERRFESLFDDPGMLVGLLDTDGLLLDANETAMGYVDATPGELRGEPFWETPWWNRSEEQQAALREWVRRAADGEYVEYTATHPGPDGDPRDVAGTVRPVADDSGTVRSLLVTGRDVTERERSRRELRNRQRKLDLVLSNTDTSVAELTLENGTEHWDEVVGNTDTGSPETPESFIETVHPEDRARLRSDLETMTAAGEPLDGEYRLVNEDGDTVWVAAQAVAVADGARNENENENENENGSAERVVAIATDITELKERERALEESQERYRTLLRAAPDPVFVADVETGDIVEANAAAEAIVGRSRDDIVGHSQTELHPTDDAELYEAAFEQSVGNSRVLSELPDGTQPQLRDADGETVPVEISTATVGLPQGPVMYGVFRDISDRRKGERELELKERAMDEANVGITISDPNQEDTPLVYVNDGFVEQTGYTRADAIGRNRRVLHADETDHAALADLRDAIANAEATTVELRDSRKNGTPFWNRLSVTPVHGENGELLNYIGVQRDITDEKTREERLRALHGSTRELLRADNSEDAAAIAVESLSAAFDFQQSALYFRRDDALVSAAMTGTSDATPPDRIERGRTPLWDAVETGDPVWYDDCGAIDDGVDRGSIVSSAYFPVGDHGAVAVGVTDSDRLDESERKLVEVLTGNLASVLDTIERQRELFEERERFRLLTESVDEYAFLVVDEDGVIRTWNNSAAQTFGYDADAAVGMSMAELHPEADRESRLPDRLLQQAQIAGESAHEGWRVREDGSTFYADVRYAPLETDDDSGGYATIVRDMTDRRRERRRTEQFVKESDDVVTVVDTDGTVRYASGSATRVLGHDPDDLVGENLFDYLHPDARERAMKTFFRGIEEPGGRFQIECRFRSGDDEWLNAEGRGRNMLDDDAIDGMLLYLRNVTESKKRARRFESIFNQTFQFTGLLAPDGTVLEANDATLEFGGVERDDIVGAPIADAPWWTHSKTARDDVVDAIERAADGEFVHYQTEGRGADGLAVVDFSLKPVTDDDGEVSMLVAEGRDITAQQQHKRHLEVMQRVMRHNMRNDLTKIRGWTRVIAEETDAEKRAERFETVERILDKWESMTEKMREIRTVLRSTQERRVGREAGVLLEEAVAPVRAEYAGVTVVTDVPDTGSKLPATLLDAVRELAENAAEASAEPTIEVELDRSADGWTEVVVSDDGPGLPDMEAKVLETGEETPLNHGQGLGLWMVRMIVTQAGGDVSVEVAGDGTEVRLLLPTARTAEAERPTETAER